MHSISRAPLLFRFWINGCIGVVLTWAVAALFAFIPPITSRIVGDGLGDTVGVLDVALLGLVLLGIVGLLIAAMFAARAFVIAYEISRSDRVGVFCVLRRRVDVVSAQLMRPWWLWLILNVACLAFRLYLLRVTDSQAAVRIVVVTNMHGFADSLVCAVSRLLKDPA